LPLRVGKTISKQRQLPLILLPAGKTTWVKPKNAAAFAERCGRGSLPFKSAGGIVRSWGQSTSVTCRESVLKEASHG